MEKENDLLKKEIKVVNMGLKSFYESLKEQNVQTVHMDWRPPAGGKKELMEILQKLR